MECLFVTQESAVSYFWRLLSHNPPEGLAEAPEDEGQYTSGRQVAPDNR